MTKVRSRRPRALEKSRDASKNRNGDEASPEPLSTCAPSPSIVWRRERSAAQRNRRGAKHGREGRVQIDHHPSRRRGVGLEEHVHEARIHAIGVQHDLLVPAPASGNLAPPGYYMLFVVNAFGVPSVSRILRVGERVPGDMNCDGAVNASDQPLFVTALVEPSGFDGCDVNNADMNGDATLDGRDILGFVEALL